MKYFSNSCSQWNWTEVLKNIFKKYWTKTLSLAFLNKSDRKAKNVFFLSSSFLNLNAVKRFLKRHPFWEKALNMFLKVFNSSIVQHSNSKTKTKKHICFFSTDHLCSKKLLTMFLKFFKIIFYVFVLIENKN